ncbi:MAG: PepSY domain-containing protein [Anaerolineae bacterium]
MSKKMVWAIAGVLTTVMLMASGVVALAVLSRTTSAAPLGQIQAAPADPAQLPTEAPASDSGAQATLSADAAAQIAMKAAPGAQLTRTPELVNYNGTVAYEVLLDQGTVYVDAGSGKVLSNSVPQLTNGSGRFGRRGGEESEHQFGGQNQGQGLDGLFGGNNDD